MTGEVAGTCTINAGCSDVLTWFVHLFSNYGAVVIALGAALEGEAAVTAGGFLAHRGMIDLRLAAFSAFLGSFVVDQALFYISRFHRERRFVQAARKRRVFKRALGMIENQPIGFCLIFRFLYGFRIIGPLAIGVSQVPIRRFVILNALSAALWATTFSYLGYRFGAAITGKLLVFMQNHWLVLGAPAALVMLGIWWIVRRRKALDECADRTERISW